VRQYNFIGKAIGCWEGGPRNVSEVLEAHGGLIAHLDAQIGKLRSECVEKEGLEEVWHELKLEPIFRAVVVVVDGEEYKQDLEVLLVATGCEEGLAMGRINWRGMMEGEKLVEDRSVAGVRMYRVKLSKVVSVLLELEEREEAAKVCLASS